MLEVRLLGAFEIRANGKPVSLPSRPAQSLFAFLVLNAGTAYRREKLAGQLWPDSTEELARDYLRHALWRIRRALQAASAATYLSADDLTIAFESSADYWFDADALRTVSETAPADELSAAVAEYRGELLPGFYDEWVVLERESMQAVYERKMACLLERLQESLRWADVQRWAETWIALGQRPEAAYRCLMEAYAATGDMSKASLAYERCVRSLAELGVEPSEQTRRLFEDLKAGRTRAARPLPLPVTYVSPARAALPVPLTSFIAREQEMAAITKLLQSQRLVTLLGPGGVGKTRLAIECAARSRARYADGVFWIDLVGLTEGSLIPDAVAKTLGLRDISHATVSEAVRDYLKGRNALLVFDNCEHLIDSSAEYVQALLGSCAHVRIMATSRERLGLFNEAAWQVPPLSEAASLRLFVERASSAQPGFVLDDASRLSALQICTQLDGMPLAIELAAARLSLLSVQEIASRLDDRFALLATGSRGALPRHQTLRATIDWSYELLSADERLLLNRLSVFAGGFTLEAAEQVCSDPALPSPQVLGALGRLVDKSLVMAAPRGEAVSRYHLLETIRQYADEQLKEVGETTSMRDRHLQFLWNKAQQAEPQLYRQSQGEWFERMEAEVDNLRSALQWSTTAAGATGRSADPDRLLLGLRLAGSLGPFWERRHRQEAIQRIRHMLALAGTPSEATAWAGLALGFLLWASGEHPAARIALEETSRTAAQFGDPYVIAWARGYLGAVLVALGEYGAAWQHLQKARELSRHLGDRGGNVLIWASGFLGDIPFAKGENDAARELYQQALAEAERLGDLNSMTYSTRRLGYLAIRQGNFDEAEQYFRQSLEINQKIGHLQGINRCVAAFAGLRAAQGRSAEAVQLCAAVEAFMQLTSASFFHWDAAFFGTVKASLRSALPKDAYRRAWQKGTALTLEQAVDLALAGGRRSSSNTR